MGELNIDLAYVFPVDGTDRHLSYAWRFLNSYHKNPPGHPHNTVVVCNGGVADATFDLFKTMPGYRLFTHDDSGWDIGAYQAVSLSSPAELLICCGGTSYFRHPGWLTRIVAAFRKWGKDVLYGSMGHTGDMAFNVYPHIRTTGFWLAPELFNKYPIRVTKPEQRYEFEHGETGLSHWCKKNGKKVLVVAWSGEYDLPRANQIVNGYHHGDQSDLLIGDRLSEPPYYPCP